MKIINTIKLVFLALCYAVALASCANFDVMVDKSQLKSSTETHDIYPSTAVTPMINADQLNAIINENLAKANESLRNATK